MGLSQYTCNVLINRLQITMGDIFQMLIKVALVSLEIQVRNSYMYILECPLGVLEVWFDSCQGFFSLYHTRVMLISSLFTFHVIYALYTIIIIYTIYM